MYEIAISEYAQRQISKLDKNLQERISSALERAKIRPLAFFEKLAGEDTYRMRVGDYRILAEIHTNRLIVLVVEVGHRKNIYKK